MAKPFSKKFYNSDEWKQCRASYIRKMPKEKRGLCERCYANGIHRLGEELHHKIFLTASNINDKEITLAHKNLILLCYDCHKEVHNMRSEKRYEFDEYGNIIPPFKKTK